MLPVLEHMVAPLQTFNPIDHSFFDELQLTPEAKAAVDFSTAVSCPVPAGALTFWTPRTLHGSMPNTGPEPRRTLLLGASYEAVPADTPIARPWQQQMTRSGASNLLGSHCLPFSVKRILMPANMNPRRCNNDGFASTE